MNIGVILPTINLWGGVKRFLELGNCFFKTGHTFTVFTPEGLPPDWFQFNGFINRIENIHSCNLDALFITGTPFLNRLLVSSAKIKIFYHILQTEDLRPVLRHPEINIFTNSSNLYQFDKKKYKIEPFKAFGGVNMTEETPDFSRKNSNTFTILTYGRLVRKRKGTRFVIKACERLYKKYKNIKLILYDTPTDTRSKQLIEKFSCKLPFEFIVNHPVEKNFELFQQGDIFAIAEKNAGWSNTCAEAMAAGTPVIATNSGTMDFLSHNESGLVVSRNSFSIAKAIDRLIRDENLRIKLAKNGYERIKKYDWNILSKTILDFLNNRYI